MHPKNISDTNDVVDDIDDFGLHFNPEKEASVTIDLSYINSKIIWKMFGLWEQLKWYEKLWLNIYSWFQDLKHKILNKGEKHGKGTNHD